MDNHCNLVRQIIPIDTSPLNKGTDNYLMVYKSKLNKFIFVPPSYVLGISDENNNAGTIDFGSF